MLQNIINFVVKKKKKTKKHVKTKKNLEKVLTLIQKSTMDKWNKNFDG